MLDKIKELKSSLTDEQMEKAAKVLNPTQFKALNEVLDADAENLQGALDGLRELLGASPLAALRLYNSLDEAQRAIIKGLMRK